MEGGRVEGNGGDGGTPQGEVTRVVAVVGPTAAGKTGLAVEIALALEGEVVNADSRLFCRGFDIGTAKPSQAERRGVPHHLIDILGPAETLGLRAFIDQADRVIASIREHGNLPVVVGGTGQYVWGLLDAWDVARVPPDADFRAGLEREAAARGFEAVAERLRRADPEAAGRIDPRNVRRVIRALEIARARAAETGPHRGEEKNSPHDSKSDRPAYDYFVIGLTLPRAELYRRVDERIDRMVADGWVDEVRRLLESGVAIDAPCMGGIGNRAIEAFAIGDPKLEDAGRKAR